MYSLLDKYAQMSVLKQVKFFQSGIVVFDKVKYNVQYIVQHNVYVL